MKLSSKVGALAGAGEVLASRTPLADKIILVSGRSSFELVQKSLMAGIPILAGTFVWLGYGNFVMHLERSRLAWRNLGGPRRRRRIRGDAA